MEGDARRDVAGEGRPNHCRCLSYGGGNGHCKRSRGASVEEGNSTLWDVEGQSDVTDILRGCGLVLFVPKSVVRSAQDRRHRSPVFSIPEAARVLSSPDASRSALSTHVLPDVE